MAKKVSDISCTYFQKLFRMEVRKTKSSTEILLYIPNIIGYIRLTLLVLAYLSYQQPVIFILFYGLSISLDFFDGWAARKFNQQSSFGAWLDVIVDNLGRTLLWSNIAQWGWIIISVEWITFVGNHRAGGSKWRDFKNLEEKFKEQQSIELSLTPPYYVLKVMDKGFKTPLGTVTILGLHVLPLWIYMWKTNFFDRIYIPFFVYFFVLLLLAVGRLICLSVELWCIKKHIRELIWEDQIEIISNDKST